jgi:DNA-directed RNA polymerase specialized sigma24 family protein
MTDTPDADLLEQYARENSGAAFTALVERHIGLVHSVALRHTANPQRAQDITQAVFIILARKAAALNRKTILPGWLYHTARLTAANLQRAETSRIAPAVLAPVAAGRSTPGYVLATLQVGKIKAAVLD